VTRRVVVTGVGMISALGVGVPAAAAALAASRSGIGPITILETRHRGKCVVGEVAHTNDDLCALAGVGGEDPGRTALLGIIAAREAVAAAGLADLADVPTGLISATTAAGLDKTEALHRTTDARKIAYMLENHDCGHSTERIADALGLRGLLSTVSTACTSSANALILAARLVSAGVLERAVAGGCDGLCRFVLNGFTSLRIVDPLACRPFDEHRCGLTLGEAGAFLVLESEAGAARRGARALAAIGGWGVANDSFHQTASSPGGDGAFTAMGVALRSARLRPAAVGWVNAHGTATENNDLSEGRALLRLFGADLPPFSSTKAATGHTMGAAGAVEAVISVLALERRTIFPNLNFSTPMKETGLAPVTAPLSAPDLAHVLSNSFGFGGDCSALLFSRA
jgi:3-oxoacyl-(acyl-carrier-protein) synthase